MGHDGDFFPDFNNTARVPGNAGPRLPAAAGEGNLALVREIAESKAEAIDIRDEKGFTPLMRASARHHDAIVEYLLAAGADPAIRNPQGRTALDLAREGLNGSEHWKRNARTFPLLEAALCAATPQMEDERAKQELQKEIDSGAGTAKPLRKRPSISFD